MKLWMDFKYALRLLKKTPGFSLLCLTVVAFGLAIVLYAFTMVYEFTFRPPPFPDGDRFAVVKIFDRETNQQLSPTANLFLRNRLVEGNQSFEHLGVLDTEFAVLTDGEGTRQYYAGVIEPALLAMTKEPPLLGRLMADGDALSGAAPVAVLGYDVWQNYYAGNPDVIGTQTTINGENRTIIGVMPESFQIGYPHQLWLPAPIVTTADVDANHGYQIIGALRDGISFDEASAEINKRLADLAVEYPSYFENRYAEVQPIGLIDSGDSGMEWVLFIFVVLILILTATNLSSLLFVRAIARQRELSVRAAVGAGAGEIIKQVLLESFILCLAGSVVAVVMADIALRLIEFDNPINVMGKSWRELWIHPNELLVGLGLMLAVWLFSGLTTAVRLLRKDLSASLEGSRTGGSSKTMNYVARTIVGVEVVMAFFILTVTGTATVAIANTYAADYGANADNAVTARITLRGNDYQTPNQRYQFIDNLSRQLQADTGFAAISFSSAPPGEFPRQTPLVLEDRELSAGESMPRHGGVVVSENYFEMMGVEITAGRGFTSSDNADSQSVVVVDQHFAERYWPNENPIGKRLKINPGQNASWSTVIGVNSPVIQGVPLTQFRQNPIFYQPLAQQVPADFYLVLSARTQPDINDITTRVREAVAQIDRNVAVESVYSLNYRQTAALISVGAGAKLLLFMSSGALVLSIIGIYGIISRSIVLRSNEIGLRQAIGSTVQRIVGLFIKQAGIFLLVGVVFGGSLGVLASTQLTVLSPTIVNYIPPVFTGVLICLGALLLSASYLPTRRILQKEPGDALRYD